MERSEGELLRQVADILRRCLEQGLAVEVEGLGTFRRRQGRGIEFIPDGRIKVFIAYVQEDLAAALRLHDDLLRSGFDPWIDKKRLLPGQNWPRAIERNIELADFFIACLSSRAVSKRGHFQAELRYALDCARKLPLEDVYLIPVRLDDCPVPRELAGHIQYVDLFPDWEAGVARVVEVMRKAARKRLCTC